MPFRRRLLLLHLDVATGLLGFAASLPARLALDQLELGYLGLYFLLAAVIFLRSYLRAPNGVLRQQLKWVTGGTLAGIVPFALRSTSCRTRWASLPRHVDRSLGAFTGADPAVFCLRHHPLSVDGCGHHFQARPGPARRLTARPCWRSTSRMVAGPDGRDLFHTAWPSGRVGEVIAIGVAVFLFQPFREWTQTRLDRFFYRDRLNYRRTILDRIRPHAYQRRVHLDPMLASGDGAAIPRTLLVDRAGGLPRRFACASGRYRLARSMGLRLSEATSEGLDLSFLSPENPALAQGEFTFSTNPRARRTTKVPRHAAPSTCCASTISSPAASTTAPWPFWGWARTVDGDFLTSEERSSCSSPSPATSPSRSTTPSSTRRWSRRPRRCSGCESFPKTSWSRCTSAFSPPNSTAASSSGTRSMEELTGVDRRETVRRLPHVRRAAAGAGRRNRRALRRGTHRQPLQIRAAQSPGSESRGQRLNGPARRARRPARRCGRGW